MRPGSEEYLDSEKFQIRIRDWEAAEAEGRTPGAVRHAAQRDPPRAPGPAAAAQPARCTAAEDDSILVFSKTADDATGARTPSSWWSTSTRTRTRETTVHLDMPALGHGLAGPLRRPRRDDRRGLDVGRAQLRPPRPVPRARPHPDRPEASADDRRPTTAHPATAPPRGCPSTEPDWFKTAVFYEVLVRSFNDSDGDGVGDFKGLTEKLDYLQWLGVDCLWVPPFFTSPLRDGGYDVADYTGVLPEVGTVEDFHEFLDEAHERGIRVIIDFVMNHTSRPAPVVPGVAQRPRRPLRRLLRLVRHRRALPGRADHLRRHRAVELDLGPGAPAVLLAPLLQPPAGPQLRQPQGPRGDVRGARRSGSTWASTASGSTPCPTSTSARAPTARTSRRPTSSSGRSASTSTSTTPAACCSPRPTSGRPTSSTTSATSRRVATSATCASTSR